jgi:hypothetical protein
MRRLAINSMSVNSILASRKGRKKKPNGPRSGRGQGLDVEPSTLENQIRDLEDIIARRKGNCEYSASLENSDKGDKSDEFEKLKGLLTLAESSLSLKASYGKLLALTGFGVIYVVTLFLQRDVSSAYGIETR